MPDMLSSFSSRSDTPFPWKEGDRQNQDCNALEDMNILVVPVIRTRPSLSSLTSSFKSIVYHANEDDISSEFSECDDSYDFSNNSDYWDEVNNLSSKWCLSHDSETADTSATSVGTDSTHSKQPSPFNDESMHRKNQSPVGHSRDYLERQQRLAKLRDEVLDPSKKKDSRVRSKAEQRQIYDLTCLLSTALDLQFGSGREETEVNGMNRVKQRQLKPMKVFKSALAVVSPRKSKFQWASKVTSVDEDS